jgi:hypothetical protein
MLKRAVLLIAVALSLTVAAPPTTAAPPPTRTATGTAIHSWTDASDEVKAQHTPETIQLYIDLYWRNVWIRTYWERVVAYAKGIEAARAAAVHHSSPPYVDGILVCNGTTLPTCGIVQRESRFQPNARNPRSSAWGLYQFLRGTWNSYCPEYPHGRASVAQQVECARRAWDNGRGSGHWRLTR